MPLGAEVDVGFQSVATEGARQKRLADELARKLEQERNSARRSP